MEHAAVGACLAFMVYVGTLVAPRGTPSTVLVAFASGAALSALAPRLFKPTLNLERTKVMTTLIDPQDGFHPGGSLAIPTADEDAERIAALRNRAHEIIAVTLDSRTQSEHPPPFTTITRVCSQALSVNFTFRDLAEFYKDPGSITIFRDCTSAVPGFEETGRALLAEMEAKGVRVEKAAAAQIAQKKRSGD